MDGGNDVFISSDLKGEWIAMVIKDRLNSLGISCMDNMDFHPGTTNVRNSAQAVTMCKKMILICTNSYMKDNWKQFEIDMMVDKCVRKKMFDLIPVIVDKDLKVNPEFNILFSPITHIEYDPEKETFWIALKNAIERECSLTDIVPAGDVGHGLAWSYYYGFLKITLPDVVSRIQTFMKEHPEYSNIRVIEKMVVVITASCMMRDTIESYDPQHVKEIGEIAKQYDRAGHKDRPYGSKVYIITNPDDKKEQYIVVPELATPIVSMYEMSEDHMARLTKEELPRQRMLFEAELFKILDSPANNECVDKAVIVKFDDEHGESLTSVLIKQCRKEVEFAEAIAKHSQGQQGQQGHD